MLTSQQLDELRTSLRTLAPRGEQLATAFFARLFRAHPPLRPLFPIDTARRNQDLMAALGTLVKNAHRINAIEHLLMEFGALNQRSGILPHHYGLARDAMLDAMHETVEGEWTESLDDAWTTMLNATSSMILRGAGRARAKAA